MKKTLAIAICLLVVTAVPYAAAQDKTEIDRLLKQLKSEDSLKQCEALYKLGKIADPDTVGPIAEMLKQSHPITAMAAMRALVNIGKPALETLIKILDGKKGSEWAAKALGEIGDERAVKPLIKALGSPSKRTCENARHALTRIGKPAFEPLLEVLKDKNPNLRFTAMNALVKIDSKKATPHLVGMLDDSEKKIRYQAVELLGKHGDADKAVEPLCRKLKGNDKEMCSHVISALANLRDSRAVKPLTEMLKGNDSVNAAKAAQALGEIGGKAALDALTELLSGSNHENAAKAAQALAETGDKAAVEPLIAALKHQEKKVRLSAVNALKGFSDERAVDPLIEVLSDSSGEVVESAAVALRDFKPEKAFNALVKATFAHYTFHGAEILKTIAAIGSERCMRFLMFRMVDSNSKISDTASELLVEAGEKVVEPLIKMLKESGKRGRFKAAEVLGDIKNKKAVPVLIKALGEDKEAEVRAGAADALGPFRDERTVDPLIKALSDSSDAVVGNAAWALAYFESTKVVNALEKAMASSDSTERRSKILRAICEIGTDRCIQYLVSQLDDSDLKICEKAFDLLFNVGEKAAEPLIKALSESGKIGRYGAARLLGGLNIKKAVTALIKALKEDKEVVVRGSAANALGRIGDEKAVGPLIAALKDDDENVRALAAESLQTITGFKLGKDHAKWNEWYEKKKKLDK